MVKASNFEKFVRYKAKQEDPNLTPNCTPGTEADTSLRSSRVHDAAVDEDTIVVQNTYCSSFGKSSAWEVEDSEHHMIKVDEFFGLFFSDDALPFLESYHNKCGDKDIKYIILKKRDMFIN
ncbi:hypothetical protein LXL04_002632 [Taraxacum kok-saghyz]